MLLKLIFAFGILVVLVAGLLFIDRPFVRLNLVPAASDQGPRVMIENQGTWDATGFGFSCSPIKITDANGNTLFESGRNASFLLAMSGQLASGEKRVYTCGLGAEEFEARAAEASMLGYASFGLRYLSYPRGRMYNITLKRKTGGVMQITKIEER